MTEFTNVTVVKKANVYFDGKVTSRTVIFVHLLPCGAASPYPAHDWTTAEVANVTRMESCRNRCEAQQSVWIVEVINSRDELGSGRVV